ncbi:MAG: exo-alpha-sialidase [Phycisphaeraceae bacterium]|nr:exo-alpha-sialidase [Phycisphaeraceae bacterium]
MIRSLCRLLTAALPAVVLFGQPALSQAQTTLFNGVTVPGVVITHSPKSSGKYIGSPSIAILPDGSYVASHDFFGPNGGQDGLGLTQVFRSTDQGQTWSLASSIVGQTWAGLFVHHDDLYILGASKGYGNLVIQKSTDGGYTWTTPSDAASGLLRAAGTYGYHTATVPVVIHNGRIWRAYEDNGSGGGWPYHFRAYTMSAPIDSDLLDASNWAHTNYLPTSTSWLPDSGFNGWLEGNAVVDRDGNMVNVLRVDVDGGDPEKAAIVSVANPYYASFDPVTSIIDMPGGAKKFTIRYSPAADKYLTVASIVNEDNYSATRLPGQIRNIMAMMSSDDLTSWTVEQIIVQDLSDVTKIGFQYMDWQFDGSDIVIASRTAYPDGLGGANNYHDANFLTFHRVSYSDLLTPGDANADGKVNLADLQILGDNWLSGGADWDLADFNGDGVVNLADLQIIGDNWGFGTTPDVSFDQAMQQSGLTLPEPGALSLLAMAVSGLILRRKRH